MTAAIEVRGLVKEYDRRRVLDGVDLRVEEGSVFGFLGPNGSGKTTTLRILLALARQTTGAVSIFGHAPGSAAARSLTGFCPDVPGFPGWMTARDVLETTSSLFRLPADLTRRRVDELLELAGLAGVGTRVAGYSRGMRQRLGLAQALVNRPRLLLLDEPSMGLAPLMVEEVFGIIGALRKQGVTILLVEQNAFEALPLADWAYVIETGRIVLSGTGRDVMRNDQVREAYLGI